MKRFYKDVSTVPSPERGGSNARSAFGKGAERRSPRDPALPNRPPRCRERQFLVFLDSRPAKTPLRAKLALPTRALADAVSEEWRAQGDDIRPHTMPLTRLANTAIDRVHGYKNEVVDKILAYTNDHLCYRAERSDDLAARQDEAWNPWLDWAAETYGARLRTGIGVRHIMQPEDAVAALRRAVAAHDAFALAGLHSAATICGSIVLALGLANGRLDAAEAFALSQLDERYQAEKWGEDPIAVERARLLLAELSAAERFVRLVRG
jgi:chaperone required for assembly of F1-ATPase